MTLVTLESKVFGITPIYGLICKAALRGLRYQPSYITILCNVEALETAKFVLCHCEGLAKLTVLLIVTRSRLQKRAQSQG